MAELQGLTGRALARIASDKRPTGGTFSRSFDGFSIGPQWLDWLAINDDKILQLEGGGDLAIYDRLLDDDVAFSTFQQRRRAVVKKPWEVEPGGKDPQSKAAADHLRMQLDAIPWDNICDKALYANWYGYGVGEFMWKVGDDGLIWMDNILFPDRKWFSFTNGGECRMRTPIDRDGIALPDRKFWVMRAGQNHDFQHYGVGLAHWCYWPIWFKKNGIRFWALFLEKYGMPTMLGKFPANASDEDKQRLLDALSAVGTDSAVIIPESFEADTMEGTRGGTGAKSYGDFSAEMNEAVMRIILSQTMTSKAGPAGLGSSQADVHMDVREEVTAADSDLMHESFNCTAPRWLTEWNFPGAKPPRVFREMETPEDLSTLAERDAKLAEFGWHLTPEKQIERYGEGYVYREPPKAIAANQPPPMLPAPGETEFAVGDAKPLYVRRELINTDEFLAWAKEQGFSETLEPGDLHVTIAYSKQPVDWSKVGDVYIWRDDDGSLTVPPGGYREVGQFEGSDAVVMAFHSYALWDRHREIKAAGASFDHDEYRPHVTITYKPGDLDIEAIEPYLGKLVFGPEIFKEIDEDWKSGLKSHKFSADDSDEIDRIVDAMLADATAFEALIEPLREAAKTATDPEALRVALLEAAEKMEPEAFAAMIARPAIAFRAAEETGIGSDKIEG